MKHVTLLLYFDIVAGMFCHATLGIVHGYSTTHWCRTTEQFADAVTKIVDNSTYFSFRRVSMNI